MRTVGPTQQSCFVDLQYIDSQAALAPAKNTALRARYPCPASHGARGLDIFKPSSGVTLECNEIHD
jgi:hypothetical protein